MNKKSEWAIGLAVAALLVGYFIYQVAYGMTTEGSYQQGYKWGRDGYQCSNFNADCDNGLNSCNVGNEIYVNVPHNYARVVDRTACLDGMVNGWKHWCKSYLELCAKFVLSNVFPGVFADNETGVNICLKDDPNNILSPINGHCGGGVGEATAFYWKAIQDNSTSWPVISMATGKVLNGAKVPPLDIHRTWNFVNETKSAMGNMSMGNMNNMTSSGKITFI